MVCPTCNKEFTPTNDLCYYIDGKLTCCWKCFYKPVTAWEKERIKLKENVRPGRKRKIFEWSINNDSKS